MIFWISVFIVCVRGACCSFLVHHLKEFSYAISETIIFLSGIVICAVE